MHSLPEISYNNARGKYFIMFSMYRCQVKVFIIITTLLLSNIIIIIIIIVWLQMETTGAV